MTTYRGQRGTVIYLKAEGLVVKSAFALSCLTVTAHTEISLPECLMDRRISFEGYVILTFKKICFDAIPHEFPVDTRGFVHTKQTL